MNNFTKIKKILLLGEEGTEEISLYRLSQLPPDILEGILPLIDRGRSFQFKLDDDYVVQVKF